MGVCSKVGQGAMAAPHKGLSMPGAAFVKGQHRLGALLCAVEPLPPEHMQRCWASASLRCAGDANVGSVEHSRLCGRARQRDKRPRVCPHPQVPPGQPVLRRRHMVVAGFVHSCAHTPACVFADPDGSAYKALGFSPGFAPDLQVSAYAKLLPMLAGIGSPGTVQEVIRGYVGDKDSKPVFDTSTPFDVLGTGYQRCVCRPRTQVDCRRMPLGACGAAAHALLGREAALIEGTALLKP
eukprot:364003-Chlamydomonas_euryale.AAC.30